MHSLDEEGRQDASVNSSVNLIESAVLVDLIGYELGPSLIHWNDGVSLVLVSDQ